MRQEIKIFADDFYSGSSEQELQPSSMQKQDGDNKESSEQVVLQRIAPDKFLLLKFGKNKYTLNGKEDEFEFTPEMAQQLIEEFRKRGKDLVIDYDHSTLDNKASFEGNAPASGWIDGCETTPEGLAVKVKKWSDKAKQRLESGEYRYFSPVIMFDDETGHPTSLQSVALTNHPALHNLEPLVAANDTSKKEAVGDNKDVSEVIKHYKEVIAETKGGIESLNDSLNDLYKGYKEIIGGNKELEQDMVAFSDSLFIKLADNDLVTQAGEITVQPPEMVANSEQPVKQEEAQPERDIMSLVLQKRDSLSGDEMLTWVDAELEATQFPSEKRVLEGEKNRLLSFKEQHPDLWEQGINAGSPSAIAYFKNAQGAQRDMMPMADIAPMFNAKTKDEMTSSIKALVDVSKQTQIFLKMHDVKSFDDLTNKIKATEKAFSDKIKKLEDDAQMEKIKSMISIAMADGKITEAEKAPAIDMAKSNFKAFCDWLNVKPKKALSLDGALREYVGDKDIPFTPTTKRQLPMNDQLKTIQDAIGWSDEDMQMLAKINNKVF